MGIGGIGIGSVIIILVIVILLFGTKRLRHLGEDLGTAVKGFRKGMGEEDSMNSKEHDDLSDTK